MILFFPPHFLTARQLADRREKRENTERDDQGIDEI
jgi:hypothetical protein